MFFHIRSLCALQACVHEKTLKNKVSKLKNPPRTLLNPSKIEPGALQRAKKRPESTAKAAKKAQET